MLSKQKPEVDGREQLWVLRSTLALKTTYTTLMSVEGNNGQLSAFVHLLCACPETTTEAIPCATVTLTQCLGCGRLGPPSRP